MQIIFDITNQKLERRDNNYIVADSKNYLHARFNFSADWDDKAKTAIFRNETNSYHIVLDNNSCLVPHEVIKKGWFSVSVFAGDLITANTLVISVAQSGLINGETPAPPTPDVYDTIINTANDAKAIAESIETRADEGDFNGQDGVTPHIGDNGNWWLGNTDLGISAQGPKGNDGQDGINGIEGNDGTNGTNGIDGADGLSGQDGNDGVTPHIGTNGNWYIGESDTGVKAQGEPGTAGADGQDGLNGIDGQDGITPHIGENGNWWLGDIDTGINATGGGDSVDIDTDDIIPEGSDTKVSSQLAMKTYVDRAIKESIELGTQSPFFNSKLGVEITTSDDVTEQLEFDIYIQTDKISVWKGSGGDPVKEYEVAIAAKTTRYRNIDMVRGQIKIFEEGILIEFDGEEEGVIDIGDQESECYIVTASGGEIASFHLTNFRYVPPLEKAELPLELKITGFTLRTHPYDGELYVKQLDGKLRRSNGIFIETGDVLVLEGWTYKYTVVYYAAIYDGNDYVYLPMLNIYDYDRGRVDILSGVTWGTDPYDPIILDDNESLAIIYNYNNTLPTPLVIDWATPDYTLPTPTGLRYNAGTEKYEVDITTATGISNYEMRFKVLNSEGTEVRAAGEWVSGDGAQTVSTEKYNLLFQVPSGTYTIVAVADQKVEDFFYIAKSEQSAGLSVTIP